MDKIKLIAEVLGYIAVGTSLIAALTPTQRDDKIAGKVLGFLHKLYSFLPSIGINPNTRILEERIGQKEGK